LAALETEALLLGVWRNVEELEDSISIEELNAILKAGRDREMRNWKFQAGLKGIKIDDEQESKDAQETGEEALERIKRRAALKAQGITNEAEVNRKVDQMEIFDMGLDFVEG
jgi:hypothetical protein